MQMPSHPPVSLVSLTLCLLLALGTLSGCGPKRINAPDPFRQAGRAATTASTLGINVVRTASTQIGKPYRSGGQSPSKGFDCSGLIYWSYLQNGITIPRITTGQAKAGQPVPRNRLQPGDIVVFRTSSSPRGLHTGIYTGQGKFIHSPNSRSRVRIDTLDTPYWKKTYLTARRIVAPLARR